MDLDHLANEGTSIVFYHLASGKTRPKEIAESMRLKTPGIIEQLHRLQSSGFVKLGKKIGKDQHYRIEWQRIAVALPKLCPRLGIAVRMARLAGQPRYARRSLTEQLASSKLLPRLIEEYFKNLSEYHRSVGYAEPVTLLNAFRGIEESLLKLFPKVQIEKIAESEARELYGLLADWYREAIEVETFESGALKNSLMKLGLLPSQDE
jgi:hypothetical protein